MTESRTPTGSAGVGWPPALTPYIAVHDARAAIDWYVKVLDAVPRGEPIVMPDGSVGHAEIGIGDAVLMLSEGSTEVPVQPPEPTGPHSHTIHAQISDVDRTVEEARQNGAHRWMLNQPPGRATRERHGDVAYITIGVRDDERAREFYGPVLGWQFEPGSVEHGWNAPMVRPMLGIAGNRQDAPPVELCYRVADMEAATALVRQHGGQAREVEQMPYGLLAECVDNQGLRFQLWQPTD
jgi:predicted enzyme related to lactoylglutathione lyase/uncharacterized glyoxalase superfamily protein PhnB